MTEATHPLSGSMSSAYRNEARRQMLLAEDATHPAHRLWLIDEALSLLNLAKRFDNDFSHLKIHRILVDECERLRPL